MTRDASHIILCNNADMDGSKRGKSVKRLNYLEEATRNVNLLLPDFVRGVYYLPDRLLDLLEIASFVYNGDRMTTRGSRDAVEYHSWSRTLEFVIRVRDEQFWNQPEVKQALAAALRFVTGDREYRFDFHPGHSTSPTSLFDREEFSVAVKKDVSVILFSGGLDSLAGVLERLLNTDDQLCLVSHQSLQPSIIRTQERLVETLKSRYPDRIYHYRFKCSLKGIRAPEETQRSRSFLYTSIAFALAYAYNQSRFYVYENGVTSINFARREDLANARSSRTTHPQTIALLQDFFSLFSDEAVSIEIPFLWKTKTDVFESIKASGHAELIPSAVSCNKTFQGTVLTTHCGQCFQCVDRRIAAYASGSEGFDDSGTYAANFISETMDCGDTRTTVVDYLRQARNFASWNVDYFYEKMMNGLSELIDSIPNCNDDIEVVERVWDLCNRHGKQVFNAIKRMRDIHDDLHQPIEDDSLLKTVDEREYLKEPIDRLVAAIVEKVSDAIPSMFRLNQPKNENDLNTKVHALLETHRPDLRSEHPEVSFAGAQVVPDHGIGSFLLVESKYIRESTTPSVATDGMAADITKYPAELHILFLVYDPTRRIVDDQEFKDAFEKTRRCTVCILR